MSESTRLKNGAIDQARDEGRLSTQRDVEPGASLGKAPDVAAAYQDAQKATQPLQKQTPSPQPAKISAAQQYDPIQAMGIRDQQQTAASPTTSQKDLVAKAVNEYRQEQGLGGSQMVQRQQPAPQLNMESSIGRSVDAQGFDQQWSAEQNRAQSYQERMGEIAKEARQDQSQDQQQGQDQSKSMSH